MQITTIGLDIAKHVFQVHAIDGEEKVVIRKQLRRGQVMQFFEELPPGRRFLPRSDRPTDAGPNPRRSAAR